SQEVKEGGVSVRLPLKWRSQPRGDDPRLIAVAGESSENGRTIQVFADRLDAPASPLQYLVEHFGLRVSSVPEEADEVGADLGVVTLAGQQGTLVTVRDINAGPGGMPILTRRTYGCAISPSLRAIVVQLSGPGEVGPSESELVRQVAASVKLRGEPDFGELSSSLSLRAEGSRAAVAKDAASLALSDQITLALPSGFMAIEQSDPNRTDRLLWPTGAPQRSAEQLGRNWTT